MSICLQSSFVTTTSCTDSKETKIVQFFRSPFRFFGPPSSSRALKRALRLPSPTKALKKMFRLPSASRALKKALQPSPNALGSKGEGKVNSILGWGLNSSEYHCFHDLHLPSGSGSTQIDHIVVSRYGVFVIETKNYSGWICGNKESTVWTQVLYDEKHKFQNPLRQNYKHTKAIESFLSLHSSAVFSVVVFVGNGEFRNIVPSNVMYANSLVRHIRSRSDPILGQEKVEWIVARLQRRRAGLGLQSSEAAHQRLVDPEPNCPRCGATMILRIARRGNNAGQEFLGCSDYPNCRGTRSITGRT